MINYSYSALYKNKQENTATIYLLENNSFCKQKMNEELALLLHLAFGPANLEVKSPIKEIGENSIEEIKDNAIKKIDANTINENTIKIKDNTNSNNLQSTTKKKIL